MALVDEVGEIRAEAVVDGTDTWEAGDIHELLPGKIHQEAIAFVAAERKPFADQLALIRSQCALLLVASLRHDLTPKVASSVFHRLARDETVGRVNIFPTVVVKIDEAAAPRPSAGKPSHF